MAAYGAATSLKNTIQRILQSSRISLVSHSPQILQPAYDQMDQLQMVLHQLDHTSCSKIRTKVNALDERIKEAVWEFEDLLESHILPQILPQLESERDSLSFPVDLQGLQHHVDCFVEKIKMMEEEYTYEMENMAEEEGEPISSRIDFGGIKSKMVGLSHEFQKARDDLLEDKSYSIIGMAGVGKTTLAKHIFEDPSIRSHFEFRAWVKVGRKCEPNELLCCVLAQADPNAYQMLAQGDDEEEELVGLLKEKLKEKKCLIVLDDVWETQAISRMINCLKENIQFLLTSRLYIICMQHGYERVRLLNEEESKELLGEKVFGEEGFPPQLEELGEKIAKKCEGLPLMIVTVAQLLSKADKTPEYWTEVLVKHRSSVFVDAYNQISEVLFPSYDYLPQYLKMFFLYMGAFCPYFDIPLMALNAMLKADVFLQPSEEESFDNFWAICLDKLSMLCHLVLDTSQEDEHWFLDRKYRVHSCWQHVCRVEASRIKFLHVFQSCDDVIKDQRRLCAHWNSLLCFKQVCDSIKSDCASTVRSLLCYGPYHPYPIPIHAMGFKLLKVLHAAPVRFYHISTEIFKLLCLRFLAITYNGDLPASISNLFHLQFLIINRHMIIKKRGVQSFVPVQIWDIEELEHLEIWGRDLPTPYCDATLNKLTRLIGVSANSCTREVLKRIPNLRILGIEAELKPYDDDETNPLNSLSYISEIQNLRSLIYRIRNPEIKHEFPTIIHLSMFPSSLTTLELSGVGYSWGSLNDIGSLLPKLELLQLNCYAFRGPEWKITPGSFLNLIELRIEDTDLVQWRPQRGSLPNLRMLRMKHCYKLQQLDLSDDQSSIRTIELEECNPLAVTSACAHRLKHKFAFNLKGGFSFLTSSDIATYLTGGGRLTPARASNHREDP